MIINDKIVKDIFNLKLKLTDKTEKILLSEYIEFIPMYDIYSNQLYLVNKNKLHFKLIDDNYRFIGSTLWTRVINTHYTINDITEINDMTIEKYNLLHDECVLFLDEILSKSIDKKVIVITHHLPIYGLTDIKYKNNIYYKYHEWFNANIDELIKKYNISAYVYGHTHIGSIQNHYNINFYCNPLGYEHEYNTTDINKFFEV